MFKNKKVCQVVCIGKNGEIGKNDELLFHIPEDLKFFKNLTIGHSLLIGRKTMDSIPNGLPRRVVTVLSSLDWSVVVPRETVLFSALSKAKKESDKLGTDLIYVVGGSSVYEQTFDCTDYLIVTHVDSEDEDADSFYKIPEGFKCAGTIVKTTTSTSGFTYCVKKYERVV